MGCGPGAGQARAPLHITDAAAAPLGRERAAAAASNRLGAERGGRQGPGGAGGGAASPAEDAPAWGAPGAGLRRPAGLRRAAEVGGRRRGCGDVAARSSLPSFLGALFGDLWVP